MEKEGKKPIGLADQATRKLRNFIINEKFEPGDLLPGEIELSQKLGVSRTIIREALSRFRLMGIVESRRRRGMVLQSPDILKGMELALDGFWLEQDAHRELFEFRLMLELGLADLLFINKTDRLFKKLERIIDKEEAAENEAERMKADAEFHACLYAATGNATLIRFQDLLYPLFAEYAADQVQNKPKPIVSHARLLHELKSGNAASFRVAMRHHLEPHFSVLQDQE